MRRGGGGERKAEIIGQHSTPTFTTYNARINVQVKENRKRERKEKKKKAIFENLLHKATAD